MKHTQNPLLWIKGYAFLLWMLFPTSNAQSACLKEMSTQISDAMHAEVSDGTSPSSDQNSARPASVTVKNFYAKSFTQSTSTRLTWQTGYEKMIQYFEVQRSEDGVNWKTIGKIYCYGNCNLYNAYEFVDSTPQAVNYYRLGQVDIDKKTSYTDISRADFSFPKDSKISLFPNPSAGTVFIETKKETSYYIFNATGTLIMSGRFSNKLQLNDLAPGMYMVKIIMDNTAENFKLLVD